VVSEVVQVGEADNGREVELQLQQLLRVTLPEAPTTGFRWVLRSPIEGVLSLVENGFESPSGAPGAAARRNWDFRAVRAGVAAIVIEYRRSWERAAGPARSFSVTARVISGAG
jgi:inhibitor of cysteine peptidase